MFYVFLILYVIVLVFNWCAAIGDWNGFCNIHLKELYPTVHRPRTLENKAIEYCLSFFVSSLFLVGTLIIAFFSSGFKYGFDYKLRDVE